MRTIPNPWGEEAMHRFLDGFMYKREAFLLDAILSAEPGSGVVEGRTETDRPFLVSPYQQGDPVRHPRHVSGADLLMMSVCLGSLHGYFFHECRWEEGWVGFGNRMEDVHFKTLAKIGPPILARSLEERVRRGSSRTLIDFSFEFSQEDRIIYQSRQTAMFLRPGNA